MPYSAEKAFDIIKFIEILHLTGDFYGKRFMLENWQKEAISQIYGTVDKQGKRQYRHVYLEIPKKNGKTTMIAGIGLYHLICDSPGGEIYCCAAEKEQAAISYRAAKQMIEQNKNIASLLKVVDSKKEIHNIKTGTFLKVLSAEAYSKHGLNPSIVIFDELHAQNNRDLWDTMSFGSASTREQPLFLTITTAGNDPDHKSIGWERHDLARKVIDGELIDPTLYAKIYGAPEDADIYDEKVWYDCNPSLGVTVDIKTVRSEAVTAKNSPAGEKLFRWLRLNQWVQLKKIGWLPLTLWDATSADWNPADMLGKRCYVGIDLSSKIDLTSIVCLFPPQDDYGWRYLTDSWIPENNMKERVDKDHVPYDVWVKNRHLNATPGDVIDYGFIRAHIEKLELMYKVDYYCGDPWHLEILKQLLPQEISGRIIEISQTMAGMSIGMGELDRMFRAKEITHLKNPLDRWSFGNVIVATDGNENIKPMKNKSIERIDPTVALIDAMNGAIRLETKRSVYEERGMRSLA